MCAKSVGETSLSLSRRRFLRISTALTIGALARPALVRSARADTAASNELLANTAIKQLFPSGPHDGSGLTFKNGMLLAMTGPGAFYGKVMSRGAQLAAKQIAAIGGPTFQISIGDHKSGDVQAGASEVRRLIGQDSIETLQTSYGAVTVAILPLIEQNKLLTFNGGGPEPAQVGKPWLYMTRMFAGDDQVAGALAWLAKAHPDIRRLAVTGTNENATEAQKVLVPKYWPAFGDGRTLVLQETTKFGSTDYANTVARIRSSNAEAVFMFNTGNDHAYLLKQLREGGFDGPVIGIEFTADAAKIAGDAYDTYIFTADYFDPKSVNPFAKQFTAAYRAEYGEDPELYAANYYEEVFMIWQLARRALEQGGDPHSSEDLQKALEKDPTFLSLYGGAENEPGKITILPDHTTSKPQGVYAIKNGVPVLLASTQKIPLDADPHTALLP